MNTMDTGSRVAWGSKLGLVLAMAGNAVGLGNFWRFPYQLGQNGGGAFLLPYFAALFLLGIPLMWIEWTMGRHGGAHGHGTEGPQVYLMARERAGAHRALWLAALAGMLAFGVTVLVNSYYLHIVGWTLGYTWLSMSGAYMDPAVKTSTIFTEYIQSPQQFIFWILSLILLAIPIMKGVTQGIERWVKIMMPVLYVFGIALAIRALTLGAPVKPEWSALKGLEYIWTPHFESLTFKSALAAAGQIFFTLSLGMGIINNYASYVKRDDDIVLSGFATVSLNELAEVILGGTVAIPIAFAFLGSDGVSSGVGLSFIALPNVFRQLPMGQVWGSCWFLILFFAGYTSAIAMYNYLVALLEEDFGMKRKLAAIAIFMLYVMVGLPVALEPILTKTAELAYLTELDNWIGTYFLVVLGLIEVLVAGWLFGGRFWGEMNRGALWSPPKWVFTVLIRYVTPLYIIILLAGTTWNYAQEGYLRAVPSFVDKPELAHLVSWCRPHALCCWWFLP